MIIPVNGHLVIEPVKHESFVSRETQTYEEVGIVTAKPRPPSVSTGTYEDFEAIDVGDRVFFDSWLAAKYPTGDGDNFFWLVNWSDVRAIEKKDA